MADLSRIRAAVSRTLTHGDNRLACMFFEATGTDEFGPFKCQVGRLNSGLKATLLDVKLLWDARADFPSLPEMDH